MSKRISATIALLLFSLAFNSIGAYAKSTGGMPPAVVSTAPVKMEAWQTAITAIGTLNANQSVNITPEVDGRITGIYFRSGDYVKAGTPLVQLYPNTLQANLAAAQAKALLSSANYMRAKELFKKHVFAQADLDNALSAYKSDAANVASSQAQLDQTLIRAPFSGRLGLRMVDLGDYVHAGDAISTLNAIDPLRVDFRIPEVYLSQITPGETILIHYSAYPNQVFQGQVYTTDSQIDANTRSLGVRAILPNKNQKLLPGAFVDVTVEAGAAQELITIPETAINLDEQGSYVFRVVAQKAVKTRVTVGQHRNGEAAILSGLNNKDIIITVGGFKVNDGDPVMAGK